MKLTDSQMGSYGDLKAPFCWAAAGMTTLDMDGVQIDFIISIAKLLPAIQCTLNY
jgi:hypothetical protein